MVRMLRSLFIVLILFLCVSDAFGGVFARGIRTSIVGPRLVSPRGESVSLAPGQPLRLVWSPHEAVDAGGAYFDLRIYSGYQRLESTCVYREKLDKRVHVAELDPGLFRNGEVYTWALRKVYDRIGNSDWSTTSFVVLKSDK